MCFSAAANFVGSGVLGTVGVVHSELKCEAQARIAFRRCPRYSAIHLDSSRVRLAGMGRHRPGLMVTHDNGRGVYALRAGAPSCFLCTAQRVCSV